ncbi:MAG: SIR2 family protein [Planctomycetes bacterium]|nr:SIR2 family protein [Planctomycetota bacterium]
MRDVFARRGNVSRALRCNGRAGRPRSQEKNVKELAKAIRAKNAMLFVGAGVSMNLGTPSWAELTAHMAERLGIAPDEFARLGDPQTLAEYYALETGSLGPLRSWMDVAWHRDAVERVRASDIHRLIVELGFPVIYTTNYDRYLELAHEAHGAPYTKIADIGAMTRTVPGATQIVKFHGDFEDDRSIVLTESSHFERLSLEGPLDLKLRADLIGRVALFIGYSVSDVGVRYLIYRLHRMWSGSAAAQARPPAYVFLGRPNPVQARVLSSWGIVPVFAEGEDIGEGLKQFLEELRTEVRRDEPRPEPDHRPAPAAKRKTSPKKPRR